ncbi:hypothetical protein JHK87_047736 [Glycine soja]|nr:hypothetical protein JHK87_047736 [Glycine soja]
MFLFTLEYLNEDALFPVKQLLLDSAQGDFAAVCSWVDEVGHTYYYHWSNALHYVDMPDFKCNNEYCRDCHDSYKRKHRCVSGAIYNYTMQLKSADESTSSEFNYNLAEAFMFLSNFVGDIHKYNWPNDVSIWEHCANNHTACPNRYASESISLACKFAYRNATPGSTLEVLHVHTCHAPLPKRLNMKRIRHMTRLFITCSDDGALYLETKLNLNMVEFLTPPKLEFLNKFLPCKPNKMHSHRETLPQVLVQVNIFNYARIAIGICNLHTLLHAICRGSREEVAFPD